MLNPTRSREVECPECEAHGRIARLDGGSFVCRLCDGAGKLTVTTPIGLDDELWEEIWDLRVKKMPHLYGIEHERCDRCGKMGCDADHDAQDREDQDAYDRAHGPGRL